MSSITPTLPVDDTEPSDKLSDRDKDRWEAQLQGGDKDRWEARAQGGEDSLDDQ